jgi:large subunit ribosomal protein L6
MPIDVPKGVDVQVSADKITVKGSNGTLTRATTGLVKVTHENGKVVFAPANESVAANAMSGTMRALVNNMVNGVSKGFEKKLTLVGVGFRAQAQGTSSICRSVSRTGGQRDAHRHQGRDANADRDRDQGRRPPGRRPSCRRSAIRPPEPYKGKGIRYADERVSLKETKKK